MRLWPKMPWSLPCWLSCTSPVNYNWKLLLGHPESLLLVLTVLGQCYPEWWLMIDPNFYHFLQIFMCLSLEHFGILFFFFKKKKFWKLNSFVSPLLYLGEERRGRIYAMSRQVSERVTLAMLIYLLSFLSGQVPYFHCMAWSVQLFFHWLFMLEDIESLKGSWICMYKYKFLAFACRVIILSEWGCHSLHWNLI